jgi:hypothetical protein
VARRFGGGWRAASLLWCFRRAGVAAGLGSSSSSVISRSNISERDVRAVAHVQQFDVVEAVTGGRVKDAAVGSAEDAFLYGDVADELNVVDLDGPVGEGGQSSRRRTRDQCAVGGLLVDA